MASFYAKEKSKYGTMSGTIIAWPVVLDNNNPSSEENKKKLPAGYLKCDGSKYNAAVYPELAAICGTGENCKFTRRNFNNEPLQSVNDDEFVVPDLGSKYPRPVPGADAGTYNSINVISKAGIEKRRSGMGIDATSTVGTTVRVTYTGKFQVPSQEISLKGKPAWTIGTNNSKLTDSEAVDPTAMHPHMHFSTTNRCRIKSTNSGTGGIEPATGLCAYSTASTIDITDWLAATSLGGTPGKNQPPCWAIASNSNAGTFGGNPKVDSVTSTLRWNICFSGGSLSELRTNCLLTSSTSYSMGSGSQNLGNGQAAAFVSYFNTCLFGPTDGPSDFSYTGSAPATYISGASGVPNDWNGTSLVDVLPLNSNNTTTTQQAYPQVTNLLSEISENTTASSTGTGSTDPTVHSHKLILTKGDHTFKVKTDAFLLDPDALTTQLTLSTDQAASLDAVSSPYIIIEYLIKI